MTDQASFFGDAPRRPSGPKAPASVRHPCIHCHRKIEPDARQNGAEACIDCATHIRDGYVRCEACGEHWVKPEPQWLRQVCTGCAFAAGREYTAEVRARTGRH